MPTIITNSNRIDLVDPIKGSNKSMTIDDTQQRLVINQGTDEEWDISGDTDESVGALARELHELAAEVATFADKLDEIGNLENLTTTAKNTIVDAANEINSKANSLVSSLSAVDSKVGNLNDLVTDDKQSIVSAVNDAFVNAVLGRSYANLIAGQLDSLITQANTWANNQLLPTVNSTVIAQGTTTAIATSDWEAAQSPISATYPYSLTIHSGVDSSNLADNPADLIASGRIMFNPADLPNDKLASWCEINYNSSSTEYELVAWAKEPVALAAISWELIIARDISASEVPDLALAKPVSNNNQSTEA